MIHITSVEMRANVGIAGSFGLGHLRLIRWQCFEFVGLLAFVLVGGGFAVEAKVPATDAKNLPVGLSFGKLQFIDHHLLMVNETPNISYLITSSFFIKFFSDQKLFKNYIIEFTIFKF